jgi:hypothetical protein
MFTQEIVPQICCAIRENKNLEGLDLRGTPIEPQNAKQFLNTLQINYTLKKFDYTPKPTEKGKVSNGIFMCITAKLKENEGTSRNDLRFRFTMKIRAINTNMEFHFVSD